MRFHLVYRWRQQLHSEQKIFVLGKSKRDSVLDWIEMYSTSLTKLEFTWVYLVIASQNVKQERKFTFLPKTSFTSLYYKFSVNITYSLHSAVRNNKQIYSYEFINDVNLIFVDYLFLILALIFSNIVIYLSLSQEVFFTSEGI